MCWGDNRFGQCNLPGAPADSVPSEPSSTELQFTSIVGGGLHSCGYVQNSKNQSQDIQYCWGDNHYGQLSGMPGASNISITIYTSAVPLRSLSPGAFHTCAIKDSSTISSRGDCVCWGANWEGQSQVPGASVSTTTQSAILSTAYDWKSVQSGGFTTCGFAIGSESKDNLVCWGYWGYGTRQVPILPTSECPSGGGAAPAAAPAAAPSDTPAAAPAATPIAAVSKISKPRDTRGRT